MNEGIELEDTAETSTTQLSQSETETDNQNEPFLNAQEEEFPETEEQPEEEEQKKSKPFREQSYLLIFIFIFFYITSDLILPLYNKLLFNGFGSLEGFHYPVTTSLIQVGIVGLLLFTFEILKHIVQKYLLKIEKNKNWIFSNFFQKM